MIDAIAEPYQKLAACRSMTRDWEVQHKPRRVLMISWAFPPAGGSGVQRSTKFAKYLPCFGWKPIVWTADRILDLPRDDSLLTDLPQGTDVRRGHYPDPLNSLCRWMKRAPSNKQGGLRSAANWRIERILVGLRNRLVPDPAVFWALGSYLACRRIIRNERVDVIYSTFSPPSNHLLGWMLKQSTGLPWVADFRDVWTTDYCYPEYGSMRKWIDRKLEKAFLEKADAVIGVTDKQSQEFCEIVPEHAAKIFTITNGADAADFAHLDHPTARQQLHGPDTRFVLGYVGWFLHNRLCDGLLEGLSKFCRWVQNDTHEFEFRIVGTLSRDMQRILSSHGIDATATGYLPHTEAIRHTVSVDALLLPTPPGDAGDKTTGGKTFEYLISGRPILVVGPSQHGEGASLVRNCHAGVCVASSEDNVFIALKDLWEKWKSGKLPEGCTRERFAPYTRRNITARLATVLDATMGVCQ